MMLKIFFSIINKKNLVIEAPTGVGKTLGYLIPALYFANKGKRIAILTETIDQQIRIFNELRNLSTYQKTEFFIGKSNYFCKSKNGKANRLYCQLNRRCIYKPNKRKFCYCGEQKIYFPYLDVYYCPFCCCDYQKAKIECIEADIAVLNNSIFFYAKEDLERKKEFDIIIVDEAHKLEDSIRRTKTIEINPDKVIGRLKYMALYYAPSILRKRLSDNNNNFWEIIENYLKSKKLDGDICKLFYKMGKDDNTIILGVIYYCYQQLKEIKETILEFPENVEINENIYFKFDCKEIMDIELNFIEKKNLDPIIAEFIDNLNNLRYLNNNFVVYRLKDSLLCEPIFVNNYLKDLYGDSVVIHCSATLGNLKLHAIKTGLDDADTLILDSPFPKDRKLIIGIEDGVNMKYELKDRDKANIIISKIIEAINGNTLILFRSFEDLDLFYKYIKKEIKNLNIDNKNIHVYEQGMDGKEASELKDRFIKEGGLLLATGRFAEGVDIPGESLIGVVIDSLPFPMPTPLLLK